jgi:predicted phosphodiesterase
MGRTTWTQTEDDDALRMSEDEFFATYPNRSYNALRQRIEKTLLNGSETYGQYRVRQAAQRHEAAIAAQRAPGMPEELPDDPEALERLFAAYREVVAASDALDGAPTKRFDWRPPDTQPVGVAWMSDIHAGAKIDYERFEADLQLVADTDGLYLAVNGDLTENTKPQAKSGTALYGALFGAPGLQLAYIATRLEWVRHKLLVIAEGNHDGFDGRWAGIDRLPDLTKKLGCEYFTETGGSIFAHIGSQTYHLVMRHNHRGNSQLNKGNSARRLWDEWPWAFENADVVALAHTHEPHLEQVIRKGELVTYLRSGTYKVADEWAENQGWRSGYGVGLTVFFPNERRIVAFHGQQFREGVDYLRMVRSRKVAA